MALLFRLGYLEGEGRHSRLFTKYPPSKVVVISKRLPMYGLETGEWTLTGNTYPHAWIVWDKHLKNTETKLVWETFSPKESADLLAEMGQKIKVKA